MQARRTWLFATRGVVAAAGLMFLLALQPEPAGITFDRFDSPARALILSVQARRYLTLQYRSYPPEFMACLMGEFTGNAVIVRRMAPPDMVQQQVGLSDPDVRPAAPPREQRGNRVHAGAAAPEGQD